METNYTDSIVVPTLLKKTQELLNSNVILDINLQIEQAKVKDLNDKIAKGSSTETQKILDLENQKKDIEASLSSRIRDLEQQLTSANSKIVDLKIEKQNAEVQCSQIQKVYETKINTLEEEIRVLKTSAQPVSKKKKAVVELEGGVF